MKRVRILKPVDVVWTCACGTTERFTIVPSRFDFKSDHILVGAVAQVPDDLDSVVTKFIHACGHKALAADIVPNDMNADCIEIVET